MDFKKNPKTKFKRVDKLKKVRHTQPMLSLNAALQEKEVKDFSDYVSSNTDYLVVGEDPGSKRDEAEKQETVKIIDEKKFEKLLKK